MKEGNSTNMPTIWILTDLVLIFAVINAYVFSAFSPWIFSILMLWHIMVSVRGYMHSSITEITKQQHEQEALKEQQKKVKHTKLQKKG